MRKTLMLAVMLLLFGLMSCGDTNTSPVSAGKTDSDTALQEEFVLDIQTPDLCGISILSKDIITYNTTVGDNVPGTVTYPQIVVVTTTETKTYPYLSLSYHRIGK